MSSAIRSMRRQSSGPIAWSRSKKHGTKMRRKGMFPGRHELDFFTFINTLKEKVRKRRLKRANKKEATRCV